MAYKTGIQQERASVTAILERSYANSIDTVTGGKPARCFLSDSDADMVNYLIDGTLPVDIVEKYRTR